MQELGSCGCCEFGALGALRGIVEAGCNGRPSQPRMRSSVQENGAEVEGHAGYPHQLMARGWQAASVPNQGRRDIRDFPFHPCQNA